MVDEALAILTILDSHSKGQAVIGSAEAVPVLVEFIGSGSPRNKENAAAVLVHLCSGDQQYLAQAQELGLMAPLLEMAQNGRDRGKRKATQLLELMSRFLERRQQEEEVQTQTEIPALNEGIQLLSIANLNDN
ncbi:unnamed protein product [Lupinus luteus]|uniref:Uncharacterized protein n=1 Tax=Lupinus luteus TaxID=3873 RepID=A0AAV1W4H6_LUPLU